MEDNRIHIFFVKQTKKLSDEIFQKFLLQLPEIFQKDIIAYKHWQSAQASLLGKIILSFGFKELNLNYILNDIKIGEKDRPFINSEIDFNISHSGEYVICAITQKAKVGIDIEKHRKLKMNIAERYFDATECNEIDTASNSERTFFDLWSLKESAIKCDGRGVEILSETHVEFNKPQKETDIINVKCANSDFYCQRIDINEQYSSAVCANSVFEFQLHQLQLMDLM